MPFMTVIKPNKPLKKVWDLPIRLCHWSMVILLALQWLTAEILDNTMTWHARFGYIFISVVVFRIVWGFIGTYYAKFSQFLSNPLTAFIYFIDSVKGKSPTYTGHNPLGGWMVFALLFLLLVQGVSGLFMTDDIFFNGPYYDAVNADTQKLMSQTHHLTFTLLKIAVGLHIAAVVFYTTRKKQALVTAMFTGNKRTNARGIVNNYWLRALILAIVTFILMYCLIEVWAPEPVEDDWY